MYLETKQIITPQDTDYIVSFYLVTVPHHEEVAIILWMVLTQWYNNIY